jgi:hypothetical protein
MSRSEVQPILEAIPAARQEVARHYGVHPYFTRRPSNVVRAYIERYSEPNDVVLDPFGGTGVTAIEAFLLGRVGIQNDLNPFANFIAQNIADTTLRSVASLKEAFQRVETRCRHAVLEIESLDDEHARAKAKEFPLPENIRLPKNSDAEFFYDMFTPRQLAGLAAIRAGIDTERAGMERNLLLLAWSASISKLNKTWLSAKGRAASRGGSSIFSIYRYKLASECVELPIWETFAGRFENIVAAKQEVLQIRDYHRTKAGGEDSLNSDKSFRVLAQDAAALEQFIAPGSVDYIFTDPPYGAFISYLDLSILWNHWLGFHIEDEARQKEAIVGGECDFSEEHYKTKLSESIAACLRLLKPDRWFSVVFQHWDLSYFATILETATNSGAELKTAITQTGDVIWSMHKKKNSESVLAGEMILTFYKPERTAPPQPVPPTSDGLEQSAILKQAFDDCLQSAATSFTSEALFNRLILSLWQLRALNCLKLDRSEFSEELQRRGWIYDEKRHVWEHKDQGKLKDELALSWK